MATINTETGSRGVSVNTDNARLATVTVSEFRFVETRLLQFKLPNYGGILVTEIPTCDLAWVQADDSVWPWDPASNLFLPRHQLPDHIREQCAYVAGIARATGRVTAKFIE
jgi:hypothetical protein